MTGSRLDCLEEPRRIQRVIESGQSPTIHFIQPADARGVAHLLLTSNGESFPVAEVDDSEMLIARNTGPDLHQVAMPLRQPGVSPAVDQVRATDFFLAGILPNWNVGDMLLPQRTAGPVDLAGVHLLEDKTRDLLRVSEFDRATGGT